MNNFKYYLYKDHGITEIWKVGAQTAFWINVPHDRDIWTESLWIFDRLNDIGYLKRHKEVITEISPEELALLL